MHPSVGVAATCCAALLLLSSCGSDVGGPPTESEVIVIHPSNATLVTGHSVQLHVAVTSDQSALQVFDIVWRSSDPRIATVSKDGMVRGGEPGTARIEARWNGNRGGTNVVVLDAGTRHTRCLAPLLLGHPEAGCQAP